MAKSSESQDTLPRSSEKKEDVYMSPAELEKFMASVEKKSGMRSGSNVKMAEKSLQEKNEEDIFLEPVNKVAELKDVLYFETILKKTHKETLLSIDNLVKDLGREPFSEDEARWLSLHLGKEVMPGADRRLTSEDVVLLLSSKEALERALSAVRDEMNHLEKQIRSTQEKLPVFSGDFPQEISDILKKWPTEKPLDEWEQGISDDEWRRRSAHNEKITKEQQVVVSEVSAQLEALKKTNTKFEKKTDGKLTAEEQSVEALKAAHNAWNQKKIFLCTCLRESGEFQKLQSVKQRCEQLENSAVA